MWKGSCFEEHIQKEKIKSTTCLPNREKLRLEFILLNIPDSCLVHAHTTARHYQVFNIVYKQEQQSYLVKEVQQASGFISMRHVCVWVWSTFTNKQMTDRNIELNWT
jgi:hypothetical protein